MATTIRMATPKDAAALLLYSFGARNSYNLRTRAAYGRCVQAPYTRYPGKTPLVSV